MDYNNEEILKKNQIIDNTIARLKKDFIGIDDQIEQIMEKVRTWYLFPQLQVRPSIVGVFGMTGTGKTDLLRKIANYLEIEQNFVYYNFAEINEMHTYEIEDSLHDDLNGEPNKFIVYDEFQYAATLDGGGEEKDNRSGMKTFWELLDSGVITTRSNWSDMRNICKCLSYLEEINASTPIQIENGIWVNSEECLKDFSPSMLIEFSTFFNFKLHKKDSSDVVENTPKCQSIGKHYDIRINGYYDDIVFESDDFIIKNEKICDIINTNFKSDKSSTKVDYIKFIETIKNVKSFDELYTIIKGVYKKISKGVTLNLSQSIIFVVANVDEAYTLCANVNPDMSPDQFNKITKKINIIDIKSYIIF